MRWASNIGTLAAGVFMKIPPPDSERSAPRSADAADPTSGVRVAGADGEHDDGSESAGREPLLRTVINSGEQRETQQNRRRTELAFSIAAVTVPLFGIGDLLFHEVNPLWQVDVMLLPRFVTTVVLTIGVT